MRDVYKLSEKFDSVMDDPRVKGILKESGGKMYMSERRWDMAVSDFFESFTNFATCGDQNATTVLKYVVLAELLSKSNVDKLQDKHALVYATDKGIEAMSNLKKGY